MHYWNYQELHQTDIHAERTFVKSLWIDTITATYWNYQDLHQFDIHTDHLLNHVLKLSCQQENISYRDYQDLH